jgi:hypothetical protein
MRTGKDKVLASGTRVVNYAAMVGRKKGSIVPLSGTGSIWDAVVVSAARKAGPIPKAPTLPKTGDFSVDDERVKVRT